MSRRSGQRSPLATERAVRNGAPSGRGLLLRLVLVGTVLATVVLAGCGDDEGVPVTGNADELAVVTPVGQREDEQPAVISAIRVLPGERLQAVVESGGCLAVSRLTAEESAGEVVLSAYTVSATDDQCTKNIVHVSVPLQLEAALGDRAVVDRSTGRTLRVVRCDADPASPFCGHAVTGTS